MHMVLIYLWESIEFDHPLEGHVTMDASELNLNQLLGIEGAVPISAGGKRGGKGRWGRRRRRREGGGEFNVAKSSPWDAIFVHLSSIKTVHIHFKLNQHSQLVISSLSTFYI